MGPDEQLDEAPARELGYDQTDVPAERANEEPRLGEGTGAPASESEKSSVPGDAEPGLRGGAGA